MTFLSDNAHRIIQAIEQSKVETVLTLYEKDYFKRGPDKYHDLVNLLKEAGLSEDTSIDYLNEFDWSKI